MKVPDCSSYPVEPGLEPVCPVFGECGGCLYQQVSYPTELRLKENKLRQALTAQGLVWPAENCFYPITPSPEVYHYRNRLDLKLLRTKDKKIHIGFSPERGFRVIPIDRCYLARREIDQFIPQLKREAAEKLPDKYRLANLVVRSGDDERVFWGGIGRRSLRMAREDYFWTRIGSRKIFYALDTFFQANLSILPRLFEMLHALPLWDQRTIFYDLYGGVGLFGIRLIDKVRRVVLIEESVPSLDLAEYNVCYHGLSAMEVVRGKVEDHWPKYLDKFSAEPQVAMVDPPRQGLSESAREVLAGPSSIKNILYLSCHPEALARDLTSFVHQDWTIKRIMPFDFFPRTKHLETLVWLERG